MTRISSKAYRDGARDQACTLRIAGVCTGGGDDTVFAHIRDSHTGGAIKASDVSGADTCGSCHRVFDRQATLSGKLLTQEEWLFYALRSLQETIERRVNQGLLTLPADAEETRKTSKRKGPAIKSQGFSEQSRPMPKSNRKIPSRPMRAKK